MLNILCFGDSITLGEKDTEKGGWADRLKTDYFAQYAEKNKQEVTLYNLGVAGETTDSLAKRFEFELNVRIPRGNQTLVVFCYGANDIVIHKNKNIVPEKYFIKSLKQCVEQALSQQCQVLILNILPIADSNEATIDQQGNLRYSSDIRNYNGILAALADKLCCGLLDIYTPFLDSNKEALLSADGVHPNSAGHDLLYQLIKQKVHQLGYR